MIPNARAADVRLSKVIGDMTIESHLYHEEIDDEEKTLGGKCEESADPRDHLARPFRVGTFKR